MSFDLLVSVQLSFLTEKRLCRRGSNLVHLKHSLFFTFGWKFKDWVTARKSFDGWDSHYFVIFRTRKPVLSWSWRSRCLCWNGSPTTTRTLAPPWRSSQTKAKRVPNTFEGLVASAACCGTRLTSSLCSSITLMRKSLIWTTTKACFPASEDSKCRKERKIQSRALPLSFSIDFV